MFGIFIWLRFYISAIWILHNKINLFFIFTWFERMGKMNIKRIISSVLSIMVVSALLPVYAEETGVVEINTYLNNQNVNTIFVGEEVESLVTFENFTDITGSDLMMRYNNDVIQLVSTGEGDTIASNGITIGADFAESFDSGYDLVSKDDGLIMYASYRKEGVDVVSVTKGDFLKLKFKAISDGEMGLRFVNKDNESDKTLVYSVTKQKRGVGCKIERVNPTGCIVDSKTTADSDVTTTVSAVTVLNAPYEPVDLAWDDSVNYRCRWSAPSSGCRGYIVEIYKDGSLVKSDETEACEYNIIDTIIENNIGNYNVKVCAKGGDKNSNFVETGDKEISAIPLADINNLKLDESTKKLAWDSVEKATNYKVTVYKDGVEEAVLDVSDVTGTEYDLSSVLSAVGDYTINVTAQSSSVLYSDSNPASVSYSTGSKITGKILYITNNTNKFKVNHILPTTVTLTEDTSEKVYSAVVKEDNTFEIDRIPNGTYSVVIKRVSGLTREFTDKLTFSKSVEKNISSENGIAFIMGDVSSEKISADSIQLLDLTLVVRNCGMITLNPGETGISDGEKCDFIIGRNDNDTDRYVDVDRELRVVTNNFYKSIDTYEDEEEFKTDHNFN